MEAETFVLANQLTIEINKYKEHLKSAKYRGYYGSIGFSLYPLGDTAFRYEEASTDYAIITKIQSIMIEMLEEKIANLEQQFSDL